MSGVLRPTVRVSVRLLLGFLLALGPLLGVMWFLNYSLKRVTDVQATLAQDQLATMTGGLALLSLLEETDGLLQKYAVTGDSGYGLKVSGLLSEIHTQAQALESFGPSEVAADLALDAQRHLQDHVALEAAMHPRAEAHARKEQLAAVRTALGRLDVQSRTTLQSVRASIRDDVAGAHALAQRAAYVAAASALIATLVCGLIILLTYRSINRPLEALTAGTRAVAAGDLDYRVTHLRRDEFGELARAFNAMVARLGHLSQLQSEFVSHAAHELKTPIVALQETTRLLLDAVPGTLSDRQLRFVELNHAAAERLAHLVTALLDLSRLETGTAYHFAPVDDIGALVRDAALAFAARAQTHGVALNIEAPRGVRQRLRLDADRITQVVQNLVDNAIAATPAGGAITVRVAQAAAPHAAAPSAALAGGVVVSVEDTGVGVSDGEKTRVFERFYRGHAPPREPIRRSHAHAGLGLAICREIVHAHGGSLKVTDAAPQGAVFSVYLPAPALEGRST